MECNQCGAVVGSFVETSVMQYLTDGRHGRSWVMRVGDDVVHVCPADTPTADTGRNRHWARNRAILAEALDEVIAAAGGSMGTAQSLLDGRLHLTASRGLPMEFVEHFAVVDAGPDAACRLSRGDSGQVVVPDVDRSELFTDVGRRIVRAAGVRSVVSTGITTRGGRSAGIVSTHRPDAAGWDEDTLERISKIADRAGAQLR